MPRKSRQVQIPPEEEQALAQMQDAIGKDVPDNSKIGYLEHGHVRAIIDGQGHVGSLSLYHTYKNSLAEFRGLEKLPRLVTLILAFGALDDVAGIEALPYAGSLKFLDLRNNQLTALPDLAPMTALTELRLGANQITSLASLSKVSSLLNLSADHNRLEHMRGISGLTNLLTLDLRDNGIEKIEGLEGLSNLSRLYFANNKISKIEGLQSQSNLSVLDLSGNRIERIEGLDGCVGLKTLSLSKNAINEIAKLPRAQHLGILELADNNIHEIKGLEAFDRLSTLDLRGNPIPAHEVQDASQQQGPKISYFFSLSKCENIVHYCREKLARESCRFSVQVIYGYSLPKGRQISEDAGRRLRSAGVAVIGGGSPRGVRTHAIGIQVCEASADQAPLYLRVPASDFTLAVLEARLQAFRPAIEAALGADAIAGTEPAFHLTCETK